MILLMLLSLAFGAADTLGGPWIGVEGGLEVSKRVDLGLSQEFRGEFPKGQSEFLTSFNTRVQLVKGVSLQGGYRLEVPLGDPVAHRLAFDLRLDKRFDLVRLKFRQRYTLGFTDIKHALRSRVGAELRFDMVRPYLQVEPFIRLEEKVRFHKVRITLGTKIMTPMPEFRVFCLFEQQLDGDRLIAGGVSAFFGAKIKKKKKPKADD
ncbi:MAG: DUF2490 domain-containing protein [Proteobacteria bacterium]|jgi:hypothetical protein|nr:DUF2490 domain-containing protein [Pseudomonadota bacterium]